MSRPRPLYGSRPLADWVRAGGRPARPVAAHALRLAWHAYWFEHNWRTAARRIADRPLPADPVFILGFWRSGTTLLHELVAAATQWTTPRTWQCFNPSTCFLTGAPARDAAAERPMDRGRISTFGPQEDEFALLLLGEPSAYRGFIDPRRLAECAREAASASAVMPAAAAPAAVAPASSVASPAALPRWQAFLRGIASDAPEGSRLLLKSPNHTFRLPLLRALFPRARFVWIGRDSGEVLASNGRMWRAMTDRYALWEAAPEALDRCLLDLLGACATVLERCVEELAPDQLLWIDFDALRAEPRRVLDATLRFLAQGAAPGSELAGPDSIAPRIARALEQVPVHAGARASPCEEVQARAMERAMAAARQRFGHGIAAPGA